MATFRCGNYNHCHNNHNCHSCTANKPPVNTCYHPRPGGKVTINGQIKLSCQYVDHHGHTTSFDIIQGNMYMIEAISQTKGLCTFAGKIVDFDTVKGIEKILDAPHIVNVGAIIVDYSTDYDAKIIRIGVDNIISIKPMQSVDQVESTTPDTYFISDPFAENQLDENTSNAEYNADSITTTYDGCSCINNPFTNV